MRFSISLTMALVASATTLPMAQAAFMVETRSGGKAFANFGYGGDTSSSSNSTATTAAVGRTASIGSVFGGNGTVVDTYVYRYTPGTDVDNTVYAPATVLGSVTGFPGQGNLATGLTGGTSGIYNVYLTVPESANVSAAGSNFTITQDGASIVLSNVILNNGGTGPDTDPGSAFVGGANNAWYKLGSVVLTAGTTYTITQASNDATFVSQRGNGVMWEYVIPEPSTLVLLGLGCMGLVSAGRRRG